MNTQMNGRMRHETQAINGYSWILYNEHPDDKLTAAIPILGAFPVTKTFHSTCPRILIEAWVTEQTKILMLQELLMPKPKIESVKWDVTKSAYGVVNPKHLPTIKMVV